ncbi:MULTISPECIES: sensor histidine kinase [unclassified Agarivorans]|uniref:sensor histidine kinase n=1 Tax=unclassified Agarivorans TaxID=2636026 RepID=UPI0010F94ACD|nr:MULTISPECIES: HAMP domain-containing sensor histidine kinase [unclassified Agarivorans]MDO6686102.1 HAMP domain-containing sensor histidine kinase [Agarivorans sp. 3_MG-2023]MDO6717723.1 HAMP domain-containing sensor histidine kinase [Agarivorans sp. 2_MG-2023]
MRIKANQLRTILALSILLGALLPSTLIGSFMLKQIAEQDQQAITQTLYLKANNIAQNIQHRVRQLLLDLQSLAQVNDVVLTPTSAIFGFHSNQLITEVLQQNDWASAIYIVDLDGRIIEGAPLQAEILDLKAHLPAVRRLNQLVKQGSNNAVVEVYQDAEFAQLVENGEAIDSDSGLLLMQPLVQKNLNAIENSQQVGALLVFVPMQSLWKEAESRISQHGSLELFHSQRLLFKGTKGEEPIRRFYIDVDLDLSNMSEPLSLSLSAESRSFWGLLVERQSNVVIILLVIFVLVAIIALMLTRRIVDPLEHLSRLVANYSEGRYDSKAPSLAYEEFNQVGSLLNSMAERVTRDQEQLEQRVTERTYELEQANHTLQDTLGKLNDTQLELVEKEKMAALGGLVAGMAHELNTPLGVGITAASQLVSNFQTIGQSLENGTLARSDLEALIRQGAEGGELLESSLQRSAALVNTFKALAGSDIDASLQRLNLKTWLEQQLQMFLQPFSERQIQLSISGANPNMLLNQRAVELVFSCLIDNSIQHGFSSQTFPHIKVDISASHETVEIVYQDNGTGVQAEDINLIFNPFYTTGRSSGNVGLGLNQVYNLVHQHLLGSVESFTAEPQGLGFKINLPREYGK